VEDSNNSDHHHRHHHIIIMVVPSERSRKGGGSAAARRRRIFTFVWGILFGAIAATCTISVWRLSLATNETLPQPESESLRTSITSSLSSASSTNSQQKTSGSNGGGGRLPNKEKWVQQSQLAKSKQTQQHSNTTTTTTMTEKKHPPMPAALAKQLAAIHERHQIINRPKSSTQEQLAVAAVPPVEQSESNARYDTSAHDVVDLENDQLHRDSRIGDMFQALGNAGNSNSNKGAPPPLKVTPTPVVTATEMTHAAAGHETTPDATTQKQEQRNEVEQQAPPTFEAFQGETPADNVQNADIAQVLEQEETNTEENVIGVTKKQAAEAKQEDKTSATTHKKSATEAIQKATDLVLEPFKKKEEKAEGIKQAETLKDEDTSSRIGTKAEETKDDTDNTRAETATSDIAVPEVQDFVKQPGVVIGVKIHGPGHVIQLKQSLCLLKAAYNDRLNYDIMIFVTEALSDNEVRDIKEVVHPAHVIIETDKQTLSQQISRLTRDQKQDLLNRCSKNSTDELFWWTRCCDEDNKGDCMPLAYNWQAEFRSKWIWYSKGLARYKWMMWYDSDAMATKVWQQDPVAFAIRNQLKMLFDHFPQGYRAHEELRGMMEDAYHGDHICDVKLVDGHLEPFRKVGGCKKPKIPQIHGFFHITDLDFYRSEANLKWFNNMIGDRKFSRSWDDQLAVTVPAALLAPNRSWDMNSNGIILDIYHNQHFDGDTKRRHRGGGYVHWWENFSNTSFPEAIEECAVYVKNSGR
jgi:hypothetical protein